MKKSLLLNVFSQAYCRCMRLCCCTLQEAVCYVGCLKISAWTLTVWSKEHFNPSVERIWTPESSSGVAGLLLAPVLNSKNVSMLQTIQVTQPCLKAEKAEVITLDTLIHGMSGPTQHNIRRKINYIFLIHQQLEHPHHTWNAKSEESGNL